MAYVYGGFAYRCALSSIISTLSHIALCVLDYPTCAGA